MRLIKLLCKWSRVCHKGYVLYVCEHLKWQQKRNIEANSNLANYCPENAWECLSRAICRTKFHSNVQGHLSNRVNFSKIQSQFSLLANYCLKIQVVENNGKKFTSIKNSIFFLQKTKKSWWNVLHNTLWPFFTPHSSSLYARQDTLLAWKIWWLPWLVTFLQYQDWVHFKPWHHQPRSQGLSSYRPLERAKRDPGWVWSRATLTIENIREGSSVISSFSRWVLSRATATLPAAFNNT